MPTPHHQDLEELRLAAAGGVGVRYSRHRMGEGIENAIVTMAGKVAKRWSHCR
jgi:hypothetical protein